MSENFDVVNVVKTAAEHCLHSLQLTWIQILQWDNRKRGISPTILFFSPSFVLVCFTILSHFFTYSNRFSLSIFAVLALHAVVKLTSNPISASLHYQFLYSCTLSLIVLYNSPALPINQGRILLAVLFPVYFHTLTSSVSITLFITFPLFIFLVCSSFHESLYITTLPAVLIVIPTIFWTKAKEGDQSLSPASSPKEISFKPNDNNVPNGLGLKEKLFLPDFSEKDTSDKEPSPGKIVSDTSTEENEKVILGISHDCRNLLNSLKVILTVMKDDNTREEICFSNQDDNLQSAIAITEHLALLLTNLLDYLKAKNQDSSCEQEMRLTTTLEKIWLMISPNLKRKYLGGSITIKNGTPLAIYLDERKFMGVLLNLIGNAMKFTDTGHIKINVNWKESVSDTQDLTFGPYDAKANLPTTGVTMKKPGLSPIETDYSRQDTIQSEQANAVFSKTTFFDLRDMDSISFTKKCFTVMSEANHNSNKSSSGVLVVTVRDTGCGIDEESLKKLFKKYGQVGEDKEKSKLGLGLGLWYTKYLLGKLNGKIDFRSTKDVGTWVKIEIPCKVAQQRREVRQMMNPVIPLPEKRPEGSKKIYVFVRENDKLVSLLVSEYLKKHLSKGVEVYEINSVYDILSSEKFRNGFSVIIGGKISVTRQETQGLRMLNRMQENGQRVPIVLIREAEDVIESVDQKWDDIDLQFTVKKPIRQIQLDEIVRSVNTSLGRILAKDRVNIALRDETAHVLIVDDENTSVMFLQQYLRKSGIPCLIARDGNEAVETYKKRYEDIRLILMDSEMPKMNGLEATKLIRRMGKDADLKIIGLTGDDSEGFKLRAREVGVNGIMIKPVQAEKLLEIVNRNLERKT